MKRSNKISLISLIVSVLAMVLSLLSFWWTYKMDTKLHRPYLGLSEVPAQFTVSSTTGDVFDSTNIIYRIQFKNFGDLPAFFNVAFNNSIASSMKAFQPSTGYLMPNQEVALQWSQPLSEVNVEEFCNWKSSVEVSYGPGKNNMSYFLKAVTELMDLPVAQRLMNELEETNHLSDALDTMTFTRYGCGNEDGAKVQVWTVEDAS